MGKPPQRVAVVEDDPSMLRSIARLLNAHGYQTVGFDSAEAFLEAHEIMLVDCLILDMQLTGMSGLQLQQHLLKTGVDLPTVFITATDDELLEEMAVRAGCAGYFHKPFAANVLLSAIEQACEERRQSD